MKPYEDQEAEEINSIYKDFPSINPLIFMVIEERYCTYHELQTIYHLNHVKLFIQHIQLKRTISSQIVM